MKESTSSIPRPMRTSSSGWQRNIPPPHGPDRAPCQLLNAELGLRDTQVVAAIDLGAGDGNLVLNSVLDCLVAWNSFVNRRHERPFQVLRDALDQPFPQGPVDSRRNSSILHRHLSLVGEPH